MILHRQKVKLSNPHHSLWKTNLSEHRDDSFYIKSDGKRFRVVEKFETMEEANSFCQRNPWASVIDVNLDSGLIYVAEILSSRGQVEERV